MDITEELFRHLNENVKTEVRPSSISGVGVFAIKNIKKGEQLFTSWKFPTGHYILPFELFNKLPASVINLLNKHYGMYSSEGKKVYLINGINLNSNIITYCNSSYPNIEKTNILQNGEAIKDINIDEEILLNYDFKLKLKKQESSLI